MNSALDVATLTRPDFAALRAWCQGLAVESIAHRYYFDAGCDESPPDARSVWRRIAAVRALVAQRAHQHGRAELADDVLDDVRASGVAVERAVRAITALERLGGAQPQLDHGVRLWFRRALANRLEGAGLRSVRDLTDHCERRGHGWWRSVPRVGAQAAAAVVAWMRAHESSLGVRLGTHVVDTLPGPLALVELSVGGGPAPLEAARPPAALDGRAGANRAPQEACLLAASNDYEAILAWLSRWSASPNTRRAYRKEAERLLAWAIVERGKAMSSLMAEDCVAYRDFLLDPQPRERWCGPMVARFSPAWRPFTGPLSLRSARQAVAILRGLFEFLSRQGWLRGNPWDAVPMPKPAASRIQVERALTVETWTALDAWLRERAAPPDAWRWRAARAAVVLLRDTGLRIAEAAGATTDRLAELAPDERTPGLWGELTIVGKGGKQRTVPVSEAAIGALRAHWLDRGAEGDAPPAGAMLAPPAGLRRPPRRVGKAVGDSVRGYSAGGLHALLLAVDIAFRRDAEVASDSDCAVPLRAHALRHTWGVHATERGVAADVVRDVLGHASLATTAIYDKAPRRRRLREAGKLFAGGNHGG